MSNRGEERRISASDYIDRFADNRRISAVGLPEDTAREIEDPVTVGVRNEMTQSHLESFGVSAWSVAEMRAALVGAMVVVNYMEERGPLLDPEILDELRRRKAAHDLSMYRPDLVHAYTQIQALGQLYRRAEQAAGPENPLK